VIALNAIADKIGGIENSLINKPGSGLSGQIQNLVVLFNGMTAKLFFLRESFPEQINFPFFVLRQRVIDDKKPVIVDTDHFFDDFVKRTGTEITTAQEINAAWIAVKPAATGGMNQINHLNAPVIINLTV